MRKPLLYQHMQSQGHLNDTIVVNQPRLTTDDDQIITVSFKKILFFTITPLKFYHIELYLLPKY